MRRACHRALDPGRLTVPLAAGADRVVRHTHSPNASPRSSASRDPPSAQPRNRWSRLYRRKLPTMPAGKKYTISTNSTPSHSSQRSG